MNDVGRVDLPALSPNEYARYEELHIAFHRATMSACDSIWLRRFSDTLLDNTRRIRHFTLRARHDYEDIAAEHQAIAEACVQRDAVAASVIYTRHMQKTLDAFVPYEATHHEQAAPVETESYTAASD